MEVIYCTFGFDVIIRCDLSLLHDSLRDNHYACDLVHVGKVTHVCLVVLVTKKSRGTIIDSPHYFLECAPYL